MFPTEMCFLSSSSITPHIYLVTVWGILSTALGTTAPGLWPFISHIFSRPVALLHLSDDTVRSRVDGTETLKILKSLCQFFVSNEEYQLTDDVWSFEHLRCFEVQHKKLHKTSLVAVVQGRSLAADQKRGGKVLIKSRMTSRFRPKDRKVVQFTLVENFLIFCVTQTSAGL